MPATTFPRVNQWRVVFIDGATFYVHRYSILTTPFVVYEAWERYAGHSACRFSTPTGEAFGMVVARPLSERIEAMAPGSEERVQLAAVRRHRLEILAEQAIEKAWPGIQAYPDANIESGRIVTREGEAA